MLGIAHCHLNIMIPMPSAPCALLESLLLRPHKCNLARTSSPSIPQKRMPDPPLHCPPPSCTACRHHCPCAIEGHFGPFCTQRHEVFCLNQCSGHGDCDQGFCKCHAGWYGSECSRKRAGEVEEAAGGWCGSVIGCVTLLYSAVPRRLVRLQVLEQECGAGRGGARLGVWKCDRVCDWVLAVPFPVNQFSLCKKVKETRRHQMGGVTMRRRQRRRQVIGEYVAWQIAVHDIWHFFTASTFCAQHSISPPLYHVFNSTCLISPHLFTPAHSACA